MTRFLASAVLAALALAAPAAAQNCNRALDRAADSYQSGDFDATIERLTTCLDANAFSAEERRNAYRLIGLSYIGKDREADARAAVAALLEVSPTYEPDPAVDPPPFVRMVAEMRRDNARQAGQPVGVVPSPSASGTRAATSAAGFSASLDALAMGYADEDGDAFGGGGGALRLGYGVSPAFTVHGRLSGSSGESTEVDGFSVSLGEIGVGARYNIGGGRASLVPYVGAALVYQMATFEANVGFGSGSVDYAGPGAELEAGLRYFFSPSLAVGGGLTAIGTSIAPDGGDAITASTVHIGLGLTWQP